MLGLEDFMAIQALVKRGVYLCDIAQPFGVHPKTVGRALKRGGLPAPRWGRRRRLLGVSRVSERAGLVSLHGSPEPPRRGGVRLGGPWAPTPRASTPTCSHGSRTDRVPWSGVRETGCRARAAIVILG